MSQSKFRKPRAPGPKPDPKPDPIQGHLIGCLNRYTCEQCGDSIITIDRDAGVTPMFLECKATPECAGTMVSSMYRDVEGVPTFEWRRPSKTQYKKADPGMRQHYDMGGMNIYPIEVTR